MRISKDAVRKHLDDLIEIAWSGESVDEKITLIGEVRDILDDLHWEYDGKVWDLTEEARNM